MEKVRGLLMLGLGAFAVFRGFAMHGGGQMWFAFGLGVVAIGLGLWRLMRRVPQRRI